MILVSGTDSCRGSAENTRAFRWEIFCQVIDNYGDIGVCWRLSTHLVALDQSVRLWVDDPCALSWLVESGEKGIANAGVEVQQWPQENALNSIKPKFLHSAVVVEAFGCEIPNPCLRALMDSFPQDQKPKRCWINLEYLSAEGYVERFHRLPSPLMSGIAAGQTRWFFYPGFTENTGGLLRNADDEARRTLWEADATYAEKWLLAHGIPPRNKPLVISLFCYEPAGLFALMEQWRQQHETNAHTSEFFSEKYFGTAHWMITSGRATQAVSTQIKHFGDRWSQNWYEFWHFLPLMPQAKFDEMLWSCDLNFVRGEDSLVRALWAGKPLIWHIYPQDDDAHHAKLNAFLDWLDAPTCLRAFHHAWNGLTPAGTLPLISPETLLLWSECIQAARRKLLTQEDLVTQLIRFAHEKS